MTSMLKRWHWILRMQFGIDLIKCIKGLGALPGFIHDAIRYRRLGGTIDAFIPCLHDKNVEGGDGRSEYFWQDLFVARQIFARKPVRHLDVGSRVDGFVAHVASYRQIEIVDVRPLDIVDENIRCHCCDLTKLSAGELQPADSVSCLHALEHFGLGRYGDALSPTGDSAGIRSLAALVAVNGLLYLSLPVGRPRTIFNANRIADPRRIVDMAGAEGLVLLSIHAFAQQEGGFLPVESIQEIANRDYTLCVFIFARR